MTSNERKGLRSEGSQSGLRQSASDSRSQIDDFGNKVTHIDNNRTIVNGITCYGYADAKKTIKNNT